MPMPQRSPAPPVASPPARKLTPVPPAAPAPPPLPRRAPPPAPALAVPRQDLESSVDRAFDHLVAPATAPAPGRATAEDLAAMQGTYAELAVAYCAPVRNVMLEVRWGEPPLLWLEQVRAALAALRAMAGQVELGELAAALDRFNGEVAAALASGAGSVSGPQRERLLSAYAPLVTCLPGAFDLEGERDRREPIILRALLALVPGLSPLAVEKFFSAGLHHLEAIAKARAEELAAVTGLEPAPAARVLELVKAEGALAAADGSKERQHLQALAERLGEEHRSVERAAAGWSAQSQTDKRRWRRQREQSWLRIKISLARLGEVDRIERLERLPFARKLETLESFLREARPAT